MTHFILVVIMGSSGFTAEFSSKKACERVLKDVKQLPILSAKCYLKEV